MQNDLCKYEREEDEKCGSNKCEEKATRFFLVGKNMGMDKDTIQEAPTVVGRCAKHAKFYAHHYQELSDEMIVVHQVMM